MVSGLCVSHEQVERVMRLVVGSTGHGWAPGKSRSSRTCPCYQVGRLPGSPGPQHWEGARTRAGQLLPKLLLHHPIPTPRPSQTAA
jgi:hypothetical protein